MVSGIGNGQGMDMSILWQKMLKKADKDGDGKVSKAELQAAMPEDGPGPSADDVFRKLDTNSDGFIDEAESAAATQKPHKGHPRPSQGADPLALFQKADSDDDGQISKADFKSALPSGTDSATANQVFDSMDANQDGVVDAQEYMAALAKTGSMNQLFPPPEGFSTLA
jgi:Ca2+-binding EF-hand superfamily protein